MIDEQLKSRILQAIREFNGELNWRGLAIAVGIDPFQSDALVAFQETVDSLQHSHAFRMEFDERGTVRFWVDEAEQRAGAALGDQLGGNLVADGRDEHGWRRNLAPITRPANRPNDLLASAHKKLRPDRAEFIRLAGTLVQ